MTTNESALTEIEEKKARRIGSFLQNPETLVWEKAEKNPETKKWESLGLPFPRAAEIKSDRCFRAQAVKQNLKAHTLVLCFPATVKYEEFVPGERVYFIDVMEIEKENSKAFSCPIDLLEFSPIFKCELLEHHHYRLPKKSFEKQSLLEHVEREIPETTEDIIEEVESENIEKLLCFCHPRRLIKIGERIICKDRIKNKKPIKKNHDAKK